MDRINIWKVRNKGAKEDEVRTEGRKEGRRAEKLGRTQGKGGRNDITVNFQPVL